MMTLYTDANGARKLRPATADDRRKRVATSRIARLDGYADAYSATPALYGWAWAGVDNLYNRVRIRTAAYASFNRAARAIAKGN